METFTPQNNLNPQEQDVIITALAKEISQLQTQRDSLQDRMRDTNWNLDKISEELEVTKSALRDVLKPLVKKSLVEYLTHPNDLVRHNAKQMLRDSGLGNDKEMGEMAMASSPGRLMKSRPSRGY